MYTEEDKQKLLDEALIFVKQCKPNLVSVTFVALAALYMEAIVAMPRGSNLKDRHANGLAALLAPFPLELTELLASIVSGEEVIIHVERP